MSAATIAERHLAAACAEGATTGHSADAICRALIGLAISKYLETRSVADVQSELWFIAENCDPETDFSFIRP